MVESPVLLRPVHSLTLLGSLTELLSEPSLLLCCNGLLFGLYNLELLEAYRLPALLPGQLSHFLLPLRVLEPIGWWVDDVGCVVSGL
ncbi:hypothetical protein BDV23DRAFT_17635 [Aspergillus alliaceus]|uniref:Uncharacterized protein n=1 Tax=Petromyces alliaceus TaxID=209559 RepID=A0A5N7CJ07_PETAA|nr:hypothetical protein BDV23DRAFT_17635 [Aspergillus alliaceus]